MRLENWLYTLPLRVRSLFRRNSVEAELDEELRYHLDRQTAAQHSKGLSADEARYAAMQTVGNTTLVAEQVRDTWGWTTVDVVVQDMRHALRGLTRSPGFAATAIGTLALAIGASTTVFTVVDSVVLKPLAFHDSNRLVTIWERLPLISPGPLGPNPRHFDLWFRQATSFSGMALLSSGASSVSTGTDRPSIFGTVTATPNLFDVLQVNPILGRTFRHEDGISGQDGVALLTWSAAQTLLPGDAAPVGKVIRVGGKPRIVIGVLPPTFVFPNRNTLRSFSGQPAIISAPEPAVFLPWSKKMDGFSWNGEYGNYIVLARLRSGISIETAGAELDTLKEPILDAMHAGQRQKGRDWLQCSVQPMKEAVVGQARLILALLLAAVLGLMLMACINLANTQLARAFWKQRESGVRLALGAPAWRLLWHSLVENLIIAAASGLLGTLLAGLAVDLLRCTAPVGLPRALELHVSGTTLLFSVGLALFAAILVSVLPALNFLRSNPQKWLQNANGRTLGGSTQTRRLHRFFIAVQVGGCTALLLLTALFSNNLLQLLRQGTGLRTEHVAFAQVNLTPEYSKPETRTVFIDALVANLKTIPGVMEATFISAAPLEGESWIESMSRIDQQQGQEPPLINLRWAASGYFETLGYCLVAGRFLEERDRDQRNVVISEAEARALFPERSAIGSRVRLQGSDYTVVGIAGDAYSTSLKSAPPRMAWVHYAHRPPTTLVFLARGTQAADELAATIRESVWSYAPNAIVVQARSLDSQVAQSLSPERFQTMVISGFGLSALLIAMLGIYGVLSYSVATRRQEIGLRMAIGATKRAIYGLTLGELGTPVCIGLAGGLLATVLSMRVVKGLLYNVESLDIWVALTAILLFAVAAAAAGYLPARQAASVHPMESLRTD